MNELARPQGSDSAAPVTARARPDPLGAMGGAALLRALSDASADVIFAKDREGRMIFANPATLALIGKPLEAVLGRTDLEFLEDKEAAREVMRNDRAIIESGEPADLEEVVPLPDGTQRIWHSRKMPWRDESGQVIGLLGVARDITDRKQGEARLRAAHESLQRILDSISDGLAVLDRDWRYTYFSATGARMLDMRAEDIVGRRVWDVFPYTEHSRFGSEFRRALQTGRPAHFEEYYPAPLDRWFECHCYPSPEGMSIYFRDVSDRKRAEQALRAGELRLRRLLEANPIGVVHGDAAGRIIDANEAYLRLIGHTRAELQAGLVRWDRLTPPEHAAKDRRAVQEAREHGVSGIYEKEYVRAGDGRRVPVLLAVATFGTEDELVAFVVDITERKQAEEKLREADRRKDEFLATLAHELRNPLAPLRNGLAVLRMAAADAGARGQVLEMMDRQVEHMVRLIDDLLDSSRLATGKLQVEKQRIDLCIVVRGAVESARGLFDGRAVGLEAHIPDGPLAVFGDRIRLDQVVTNLLTNAAKFTPPGGTVSVVLDEAGGSARVRVKDSGLGIPPAKLEAIFELFAQLHPPGSEHFQIGGLGIGLNLARRLVQLHGGTLAATSEGLGKGSEFTVTLPLVV
jgi:PAS domain S-box-containing protein